MRCFEMIRSDSYLGQVHSPRKRTRFSVKTVIVSHSPQTIGEVLDLGQLVCLSTDCSRGGLSTLEVWSGTIIQASEKGQLKESKRQAGAVTEEGLSQTG